MSYMPGYEPRRKLTSNGSDAISNAVTMKSEAATKIDLFSVLRKYKARTLRRGTYAFAVAEPVSPSADLVAIWMTGARIPASQLSDEQMDSPVPR